MVLKFKSDEFHLKEPEYKFSVQLTEEFAGISLEKAQKDEKVRVAQKGFFTDYDGEFFFDTVDSISNIFLNQWAINEHKNVSKISNYLILIDKENKAEVSINIPISLEIIPKRDIKGDSPIYKEDIGDIRKLLLEGVNLKENVNVIFLFSVGWRRGIYFDFLLKNEKDPSNAVDLPTLFASFYSYLNFPEIHRLDDKIKDQMYSEGWFPFIKILGNNFEGLSRCYLNEFPTRDEGFKIVDSYDKRSILEMKDRWMTKNIFLNQKSIIEKGIDRFLNEDYISSISVLYPRIEGIMRHIYLSEKDNPTSQKLADKISEIASKDTIELSLFLPQDFNNYLKKFYFASFNLKAGDLELSRHSLGHGVAKEEDFSKIRAFQGILILDQLFYYV